jgi:hypothetical protein
LSNIPNFGFVATDILPSPHACQAVFYRRTGAAGGLRQRVSREFSAGLAGAPGFEPGNGGIKIRCLTSWRRPNAPEIQPGTGRSSSGLRAALQPLRQEKLCATPAARHEVELNSDFSRPKRLRSPDEACKEPASRRSRSVAQPGSAPRSGRGGRRFESCHSDHATFSPNANLRFMPIAGRALSGGDRRSRIRVRILPLRPRDFLPMMPQPITRSASAAATNRWYSVEAGTKSPIGFPWASNWSYQPPRNGPER